DSIARPALNIARFSLPGYLSSPGGVSAIDWQDGARDEAGLVGGQERHGGGDLLRPADPAHRVAVDEHGEEAVGVVHRRHGLAKHRGIDRPRADAVDPD